VRAILPHPINLFDTDPALPDCLETPAASAYLS